MAKILPTPQEVRDLSISGEFNAVADGPIIALRDNVIAPLYSASDVTEHTQWTSVVAYHVAHYLHIKLVLENNGGDIGALAGTSAKALQGVGSRGKAIGALNPADMVDWLKIPSAYLGPLLSMRETLPPSVHTTGGG